MLETVMSVWSRIYALPCVDVGTPRCAASLSVACSPVICALAPVAAGFLATAVMAGAAGALRGMMVKPRYWLARRICRRYARSYLHHVDRMGLDWTLALIDEDIELHGHAFNHALHGPALSTTANSRDLISRRSYLAGGLSGCPPRSI